MIFHVLMMPTKSRSVGYISKRHKFEKLQQIPHLILEPGKGATWLLTVDDNDIKETERTLRIANIAYYKEGGREPLSMVVEPYTKKGGPLPQGWEADAFWCGYDNQRRSFVPGRKGLLFWRAGRRRKKAEPDLTPPLATGASR